MPLKLYYDLMSQPCRAILIFLKKAEIPYTPVLVDIAKGLVYLPQFLGQLGHYSRLLPEHLILVLIIIHVSHWLLILNRRDRPSVRNTGAFFSSGQNRDPAFTAINPLNRVPVIQDDNFILKESVAIFRYLAATRKIADHWYPADVKKRARVDEYMAWQHHNTRLFGTMVFRTQFIDSFQMGNPLDVGKLAQYQEGLQNVLDNIETVYLKDNREYLLGDGLTFADLLGVCELMQPYGVGQDVRVDRPLIGKWMDRVMADTQPHFDDVHKILYKVRKIFLKSNM